jgi:hypothetical protein
MNESKVQCVVCREDIIEGATKCTHCDAYQDWRRYFGVSNIFLSLMIALISVSTTLYQVVKASVPKSTEIQAIGVGNQNEYLQVAISNTGTAIAIIHGGRLKVKRNNKLTDPSYELRLNAPDGKIDPFVEPNKGRIIFLRPYYAGGATELPKMESGDTDCQYDVEVDISGFGGTVEPFHLQPEDCMR